MVLIWQRHENDGRRRPQSKSDWSWEREERGITQEGKELGFFFLFFNEKRYDRYDNFITSAYMEHALANVNKLG